MCVPVGFGSFWFGCVSPPWALGAVVAWLPGVLLCVLSVLCLRARLLRRSGFPLKFFAEGPGWVGGPAPPVGRFGSFFKCFGVCPPVGSGWLGGACQARSLGIL